MNDEQLAREYDEVLAIYKKKRGQQLRRKMLDRMTDAASHAGLTFDASEKTLVFYAATFDQEPDRVGDILSTSSFDRWYKRWCADPLKEYPATRGKLAVVYGHEWTKPDALLGFCDPEDVTIDTKGLLVSVRLLDTEVARTVWEIARDAGVGASFSYEVAKGGEHRGKGGYNYITEFNKVLEVGPVLFGANEHAGTVGVKKFDQLTAELRSLERALAQRKTSKAASERTVAGEDDVASVVEPDYEPTRCTCGRYATTRRNPPVVGGSVDWKLCENCGTILAFEPKSMPLDQHFAEIAKIKSQVNFERYDETTRSWIDVRWDAKSKSWVDVVKTVKKPHPRTRPRPYTFRDSEAKALRELKEERQRERYRDAYQRHIEQGRTITVADIAAKYDRPRVIDRYIKKIDAVERDRVKQELRDLERFADTIKER